MAQLRSQLVAVVMLRDLARVVRGKISPVTTHARGPQVLAKKKMKMQTKATAVCCPAIFLTKMSPFSRWPVDKVPQTATMSCETHMPMAPVRRRGRRPHLSMAKRPGMVETTLMAEVIMAMVKPLETPEFWKYRVP